MSTNSYYNLFPFQVKPFDKKVNEDKVLFYKAQHGDIDARNTIVENNIGLIFFPILKKYPYLAQEDLVQEMLLELINCVRRYDIEKDIAFSTFVCNTLPLKVLRNYKELKVNAPVKQKHVYHDYCLLIQRGYTKEQIKKELHISDKTIEGFNRFETMVSLGFSLQGETALVELVASSSNVEEKVTEHIFVQEIIEYLEKEVKPKYLAILKRYFGLDGEEPETLQEIANSLGVSRQYIQAVKTKVLEQVKQEFSS